MTVEEVAEFLRVHSSTIYRLLKKHRIPAFKIGSDWRFSQESIERWIREPESGTSSGESLNHAGTVAALESARRVRIPVRG